MKREPICNLQEKILLLVTCYLLLVTGLYGCQNKPIYKDTQVLMGTFVEVASPDKNAAKIAFAEIRRIENLLSKYKPDSEVSRLNKSGKLAVSPDTLYIINKAREFWEASNGAFDISVGPLMDLWGFTDRNYRLPGKAEIENTLHFLGFDKIIIDNFKKVIEFRSLGMKVDLGAIAKGYAVDCAVKRLKEKSIKNCLINAGGDIYCLGDRFGRPWRVALQNPRKKDFLDYLELKDRAVATSGDYEQYFSADKRRYSHIFNLNTGYPVDSGVVSVTVLAPDCLTADALATAIFVLGRDRGEELAKKFAHVEVRVIEAKGLVKKDS